MANKPLAQSLEAIYRYFTTGSVTLATTELTRKGVVESASLIAEDAVLAASTTKPGLVELAIGSEVTTGTDATRAVTPKALADAGFTAAHADEVAATETVAGIVELATTTEAATGTDTARAVTPAGVAAAVPAASTTVVGKVELATNLEARAVTSEALAVTPYGLGHAIAAGLDLISFAGRNGQGACTATGLKVSDIVLTVVGVTTYGASAAFETVITVNDQIQQSSASDLNAEGFVALVYRSVA